MAVEAPPRGLLWIMLCNVVMSVNYSMLMVTGFQYISELGQSDLFYGAVVAAFPIGRVVFLMPIGYWSDKSAFRMPILLCNLLSIVGGVMYGMASFAGSPILALLGRFVGGAGGTQPLSAWAARGYPPEKRAQIESMQKSMNLLGVIVGPALNAFVSGLDVEIGPFYLNARTAAGYCPALLSIILLVGCFFYIEEPPAIEQTSQGESQNPFKGLLTSGAWVCLLLAFQTNLQLAAIDTVPTDLNSQTLGWGVVSNSICFGIIAFLSLFGAVVAIVLLKRGVRSNGVVCIGVMINMAAAIPGMLAVKDAPNSVNMTLFLVFGAIQCFALMLYTGPTGGLYQQACGNSQGLLGGLYTMAFSGGRPFGSMLGGELLDRDALPMVVTVLVIIFVSISLHLSMWRRLQRTDDMAIETKTKGKEAFVGK